MGKKKGQRAKRTANKPVEQTTKGKKKNKQKMGR